MTLSAFMRSARRTRRATLDTALPFRICVTRFQRYEIGMTTGMSSRPSSNACSMVTTRSRAGISADRARMRVVFPNSSHRRRRCSSSIERRRPGSCGDTRQRSRVPRGHQGTGRRSDVVGSIRPAVRRPTSEPKACCRQEASSRALGAPYRNVALTVRIEPLPNVGSPLTQHQNRRLDRAEPSDRSRRSPILDRIH